MKRKYVILLSYLIIIISFLSIIIENNYDKKKIPSYNYKVLKNTNYNVVLKPNNFYNTKILPSNLYYISSSIDTINFNLIYKFKGNKTAIKDYTYTIETIILGNINENGNNKEVWKKNFLLKKNNINIKDNKFSLTEKININYNYYNNLSHNFENEYNIKLNSILKLRLNISYKINKNKVKDSIEIEMPLTDNITEVKKNYKKENIKNFYHKKKTNYIKYYIPIILIIISITIILYNIKTKKDKINSILKKYKEIIININNKPDLTNKNILYLKNIEDLIDISELTNNTIIYYKEENIFYIFNNDYVFIYKYIKYESK